MSPTPAIRRIVIEAYNSASQQITDANGKLLHRPNTLEQVIAQEAAVAELESAIRKMRSAIDAAKDSV